MPRTNAYIDVMGTLQPDLATDLLAERDAEAIKRAYDMAENSEVAPYVNKGQEPSTEELTRAIMARFPEILRRLGE